MAISFDDKLDPRRLRYFMQVVERGSVRGAAEALDMDASAVSRAIAQLEGDCGVSLLARHGRGIVVTEAGELLAVFARRLQNQKQQLLGQLDKIQKVALGHVDLVGGEGFVEWLTRNSLLRFMTDRPGITVDLDVAGTEEIVRRIVDERAHIGLVFRPPRDERLRLHGACPMPIVALVRESHPLACLGRPLRLVDLLPYPGGAVHESFGVRQHIDAAAISEGQRLQPVFTTSSFSALGHFVAAGLGYALSTGLCIPHLGKGAERILALPMQNPLLSQGQVHVVTRHGRVLPRAAAALLRQIIEDMPLLEQAVCAGTREEV